MRLQCGRERNHVIILYRHPFEPGKSALSPQAPPALAAQTETKKLYVGEVHKSTCVGPARLDWTSRPRGSPLVARHTGVSRWLSHTAVRIAVDQARESAVPERLRTRRSTHAALRTRSFCDHWRGKTQLLAGNEHQKGRRALMQQRSAKKGSRPPALQRAVRESGRQNSSSTATARCGQAKRQTALDSEVMRSNHGQPGPLIELGCVPARALAAPAIAAAAAACTCRRQPTSSAHAF